MALSISDYAKHGHQNFALWLVMGLFWLQKQCHLGSRIPRPDHVVVAATDLGWVVCEVLGQNSSYYVFASGLKSHIGLFCAASFIQRRRLSPVFLSTYRQQVSQILFNSLLCRIWGLCGEIACVFRILLFSCKKCKQLFAKGMFKILR